MDASFLHRWQIIDDNPVEGDRTRPRSRSPPSPALILLDRLDLVAEPRRGLVVFGGDGPFQLVPELDQGRLLLGVPRRPLGDLAGMSGIAVDALEQRHQLVPKDLIIIRTAEPTGIA